MHKDFVCLQDIDSSILQNVCYASRNNCIGRPVAGYLAPKILCTEKAARQLAKVQAYFQPKGCSLVVYDGYRPEKAVRDFKKWSLKSTSTDQKQLYYPTHEKSQLFGLGYIAERSTHSRGSTFDLTLIEKGKTLQTPTLKTQELKDGSVVPSLDDGTLQMGSHFDLFHEASHHDFPLVPEPLLKKRDWLRQGMIRFGFEPYAKEWWHYTLKDEPFKETAFDFDIT